MKKGLPKITLAFIDEPGFNATVRHPGDIQTLALIEMNTDLLTNLYESVSAHSNAILIAAFPAEYSTTEHEQELMLSLVYDVVVHFVLLHEIFHLLSGHLEYSQQEFGMASINEQMPEFSEDNFDSRACYLELEADGNAIALLVGECQFAAMSELASNCFDAPIDATGAYALDGPARAMAFRVLLLGVWIAAGLLEQARWESTNHPMPAGRLLSLLSTLMAWYSEVDALVTNERGEKIQRLSDEQAHAVEEFLDHVAKPVSTYFWSFPDKETSKRLGLEVGDHAAGELLRDLKRLVKREGCKTSAGQQLEHLESLRLTIEPELEPMRQFSEKRS